MVRLSAAANDLSHSRTGSVPKWGPKKADIKYRVWHGWMVSEMVRLAMIRHCLLEKLRHSGAYPGGTRAGMNGYWTIWDDQDCGVRIRGEGALLQEGPL